MSIVYTRQNLYDNYLLIVFGICFDNTNNWNECDEFELLYLPTRQYAATYLFHSTYYKLNNGHFVIIILMNIAIIPPSTFFFYMTGKCELKQQQQQQQNAAASEYWYYESKRLTD